MPLLAPVTNQTVPAAAMHAEQFYTLPTAAVRRLQLIRNAFPLSAHCIPRYESAGRPGKSETSCNTVFVIVFKRMLQPRHNKGNRLCFAALALLTGQVPGSKFRATGSFIPACVQCKWHCSLIMMRYLHDFLVMIMSIYIIILPVTRLYRRAKRYLRPVCNMVVCLASSIEKANPGLLGALPQ